MQKDGVCKSALPAPRILRALLLRQNKYGKNMKAAVLVRFGNAQDAFEIRELPDLPCKPHEVRVAVATFGLNFADVVARLGQYQDCPPLPAVIGYEVVGQVLETGAEVTHVQPGQRVLAFTRFGGYATQIVTDARAVVPLPDFIPDAEATALATQYCTAYFSACMAINLWPGDHVLIQAAAGGVGIALTQIAKNAGCTVYGTAGSDAKLETIRKNGVDVPINYTTHNFARVIEKTAPNGKIDVVFDSVGGQSVREGIKLLNSGGRMVCFGAADMSGANKLQVAWKAMQFGLYHPVQFMLRSASLTGVNMLRIAENKPLVLQQCLQEVVKKAAEGQLKPIVHGVYPISQLWQAHEALQHRSTVGKLAIQW